MNETDLRQAAEAWLDAQAAEHVARAKLNKCQAEYEAATKKRAEIEKALGNSVGRQIPERLVPNLNCGRATLLVSWREYASGADIRCFDAKGERIWR